MSDLYLNPSKFIAWTDEELEWLVETLDVCWSEGLVPNDKGFQEAILKEVEERGLDKPYWTDILRKEEP